MRKIIKSLLIITIIYTFVGFFVLPYYLQSNLSKILNKSFSIESYVDSIHFNPLTYEVTVQNFLLKDKQKNNLVYFETLYVDLKLTDLIQGKIHLDHLKFHNLKVDISLDKNQKPNFQFLIDSFTSKKSDNTDQSDENSTSLAFSIGTADFTYLNFIFTDYSKQEPFTVETRPFDINLQNIAMTANHINNISLKIDTKDSGSILLDSNLTVEPFAAQGILKLEKINLNKKYNYFKTDDINIDLNSKEIDLGLEYKLKLENSLVTLSLFNIFLDVPKIQVIQNPYAVTFNEFTSKIKDFKLNINDKFDYKVSNLEIKSKKIKFDDNTVKHNLQFKDFIANIPTVTSSKKENIAFFTVLKMPQKGTLDINGGVVLEPVKLKTDISLKNTTLKPYGKYLEQFTNIAIDSFNLDTKGYLEVSLDNEKPNYQFSGDTQISHIKLSNRNSKQKLLDIENLSVKKLKLDNSSLNIEQVTIEKPNINLDIKTDKTTNFSNLLKETKQTQNDKKPSKETFDFGVKKILVKNGTFDFTDKTISPNFSSKQDQINIEIKNLTLDPKEKTTITNSSVIDKYALLKIDSKLSLLDPLNDLRLQLKLQNLDLPSLSSYSGKFIGNEIQEGKLALDLDHIIASGLLESKNNIKIKDIELGQKVESKDAIDAPIGLAIALLEDSSGMIDLDIPMDGDVKSPNFDISDAISDVIVNTIVGIVTAPFKFLAILSGLDGDNDLSTIGFSYGESTIEVTQKEKLDTLAKSLTQRPNLELSITPAYYYEHDLNSLKEKRFKETYPLIYDSAYEFEKLYEYIKSEFIKIFKEEAYTKLDKDKTKRYPVMLDSLKDLVTIEITDIEALAQERALNVKNYLVEKGIKKNRIKVTKKYQSDKFDTKLKQIIVSFELEQIKKKSK